MTDARICKYLFRNGAPTVDYSGLLEQVKDDYKEVVDALAELKASIG